MMTRTNHGALIPLPARDRFAAFVDEWLRLEDWRWEQEAREGKRGLIINLTAQ